METGDTNRYRTRIGIDELKVGMYCEDVFNDKDVLMVSARMPISSIEQILALKRQGVKSVEINVQKGAPRPAEQRLMDTLKSGAKKLLEEELPKAREVYSRTLHTARKVLKAIRMGRWFSEKEIEEIVEEIVESLLRNPDAMLSLSQIKVYDEYTYEHSVNVSILACSLAHAMAYDRDSLVQVGIGGLLHDIGKMRIPEYIVNKPAKFTETEFAIMKRHSEYGLDIVKGRKAIPDLSKKMIIQHHERLNGSGYPCGLRGDHLHILGSVAGIADVYDAMTSKRIYRDAFMPQQALVTIYNGIDAEFPRPVVELFVKLLGVYPVGSFVRLTSGEMGIVIKVEREEILYPDVAVLFSAAGTPLAAPKIHRLSQQSGKGPGTKRPIEKSLDPRLFGVDVNEFINTKMTG